jgi:hypothetical protein
MILNGFPRFPLELWITLWATCLGRSETLAARGLGKDCPLSWHWLELNEIKHLARLGGNTVLRCNTRSAAIKVAPFWG